MLLSIDFNEEALLVDHDFYFRGTFERAIKLGASQSLRVIFEYIFEINQNPESYYDLIMLDFVQILQCRNLDIDIFFKKPMNEDEVTMANRRILNFERSLTDFSLP